MNEISYFDLVITTLILLLGLKGVINGFFKEIFGMLGIVGGVFVGSKFGPLLGSKIDSAVFHFENETAIAFTGFVIVLAIFWISMSYIGHLFSKLSVKSGLKPMDRLFGFALGAGKIFFIFSALIFTISNIGIVKKSLTTTFDNSTLYPLLYATGSVIAQIDPDIWKDKVQEEANQKAKQIQDVIQTEVQKSVQKELNVSDQTVHSLEDELKALKK